LWGYEADSGIPLLFADLCFKSRILFPLQEIWEKKSYKFFLNHVIYCYSYKSLWVLVINLIVALFLFMKFITFLLCLIVDVEYNILCCVHSFFLFSNIILKAIKVIKLSRIDETTEAKHTQVEVYIFNFLYLLLIF